MELLQWPAKRARSVSSRFIDWTDRLLVGDSIVDAGADGQGVGIDSRTMQGNIVYLKLSGGSPGAAAQVVCWMRTATGEYEEEVVLIDIEG